MGRKQRRPRLLLLTTTNDIGGMPRITAGLARAFVSRHWLVRYVFPFWPDNAAALAWYREQGIDAEISAVAPGFWLRRKVRNLVALCRFVRQSNADVVNLHYGDNTISLKDVVAVRLAGARRCVVCVHHPTPLNGVKEGRRRMTGFAAHLAHSVIVFSRATRESLLEDGAPAHKIHVIPCGLPIPSHLPTREEARERLGLPSTAFVVASLARLAREKGMADLIAAVAQLPVQRREVTLVVAGDGPERCALEELAAGQLGQRAVFLGRLADTADLYAAADVFVLPSYMEGFGLVYVEAAFHGVPSIGTNVGGVPDAIADGETGLLVPPGNPSALAAAIQTLHDDSALRLRLGQAAQRRAQTEFTESRMAERFAEVFQIGTPTTPLSS